MITIDTTIYSLYPNIKSIVQSQECFDINGNSVEVDWSLVNTKYAELVEQAQINLCKDTAKQRIAASDWSVLPDVGISNTAEFETYRAALRELIKNPVAEPTWPTEPEPIWS
jgi:hypothetical protein